MHPMFVQLFLEPDDPLAEEEKRRSARARPDRSRLTVRSAPRDRDRRPSQ